MEHKEPSSGFWIVMGLLSVFLGLILALGFCLELGRWFQGGLKGSVSAVLPMVLVGAGAVALIVPGVRLAQLRSWDKVNEFGQTAEARIWCMLLFGLSLEQTIRKDSWGYLALAAVALWQVSRLPSRKAERI